MAYDKQNHPSYPSPEERLKELTDKLESGVKDVFESEKYKDFLNTVSKFHKYSINNCILIALQKPDASYVASFNTWNKKFNRKILPGSKGIKIIAPVIYKKEVYEDKKDPKTGEIIKKADGTPEKVKKTVFKRTGFKAENVFDISQTEGQELTLSLGVDELKGDVRNYNVFLESLERICPVPVFFQNTGDAKGYFNRAENFIAVGENMSEVQTLKTLIHEMAHQRLHSIGNTADKENKLSRDTMEVQAESVAYTVCQHYGIDTSDYSFGYIAGWAQGREMEELKDSLSVIRTTASEMIAEIDTAFNDLLIEKGTIQNKAQETQDHKENKEEYRNIQGDSPRDSAVVTKNSQQIVRKDEREGKAKEASQHQSAKTNAKNAEKNGNNKPMSIIAKLNQYKKKQEEARNNDKSKGKDSPNVKKEEELPFV